MMQRLRGFTLIELMMVIALVAILVTLAAPSFYDLILLQRLKSVTAQVMTDLQLARTEAAGRNLPVQVRFSSNTAETCYVLYTGHPNDCNCVNTPVCTVSPQQEVRTVHVPASTGVSVRTVFAETNPFSYDPATGALTLAAQDTGVDATTPIRIKSSLDSQRVLNVLVKYSGRPTLCAPSGSTVTGMTAC